MQLAAVQPAQPNRMTTRLSPRVFRALPLSDIDLQWYRTEIARVLQHGKEICCQVGEDPHAYFQRYNKLFLQDVTENPTHGAASDALLFAFGGVRELMRMHQLPVQPLPALNPPWFSVSNV